MVGRMNGSIATVQTSSSVGKASPDKDVKVVAPVQAVKVRVEGNPQEEQKMSAEKAKSMVDSMNKFLKSADSQLKFQYHEALNEYYVTIIDTATDEVIREIPSKKLMDIHAAMREFVGLLVDRKI